MTDGYSMTFADLLAEWGHTPSCSLRTCRGCSLQTVGTLWPQSFLDWPQSATASTTGLWKRPPLARPISDDDGGALLGTPRTSTKNGASSVAVETGDHWHRLEAQIAMLPTPTAQAAKHGSTPDVTANRYGHNLWDRPHLLPTPRAQNGQNNKIYPRPLDQPQNLENALARLPNALDSTQKQSDSGNVSWEEPPLIPPSTDESPPLSLNG